MIDSRVEVEKGRKSPIEELAENVRQIAYGVHVYLTNGYLEKVYENCLKHRLEKAGYKVEAQKNLKVYDEDGFEIGDYFADLIVNDSLIVELKSVKALSGEHYAQTLNYLKITGYKLALLINFGSYKFETRTVIPNFSSLPLSPSTRINTSTGSGVSPDINSSLHISPSTWLKQ